MVGGRIWGKVVGEEGYGESGRGRRDWGGGGGGGEKGEAYDKTIHINHVHTTFNVTHSSTILVRERNSLVSYSERHAQQHGTLYPW